MSSTPLVPSVNREPVSSASNDRPSSSRARALLVLCTAAALMVGVLVTRAPASQQAVALAGDDLTRLLRSMALLKSVMSAGVLCAVLWRLAAPVSAARFVVYATACAAMAAGPGLIWGMVFVGAGAALLHGGLLVAAVCFWRDPEVGRRLAAVLASRRRSATRVP